MQLGAAAVFPAAFGMMALATPIVEVFYGREWHAAVHPLMFVAIWTGLASMASMPGAVFKATGRSWLLTATGIMQLAVLVPAVFISVHWGITAVAASQVIEKTISLTLLGIVVAPVIRVRWYASWVAAAPPIVLSAITGAIVYWIARGVAAGCRAARRHSRRGVDLRGALARLHAGCVAPALESAHRGGSGGAVSLPTSERSDMAGQLWIGEPSYWKVSERAVSWAKGPSRRTARAHLRRSRLGLERLDVLGRGVDVEKRRTNVVVNGTSSSGPQTRACRCSSCAGPAKDLIAND